MYLFTFIYVYLLKKIILLLNGNYVNSLSSLFFILNLYAPTDNYLDLILIILSSVSSIHHSVRDLYRNSLNKFIHSCDSGAISWLSSYLFLKKINILYPKLISFLIFITIIILEFVYNLKTIKKIIVLITFLYIIYLKPLFLFFILLSLFFFFNSDKWDKNNIYRYGWHFTSSMSILFYLFTLF